MSSDEYQKSIETGELQLSTSNRLTHFSIVGFCFFIPSAGVVLIFINSFRSWEIDILPLPLILIFMVLPSIIGILFYRLQKNRLKFKVVETNLKEQEIIQIVQEVGESLKWIIVYRDSKTFLAKTNPSWFSGSWGEQITILFDTNKVLVNSICDLGKQTSVVSFGRNRKNENSLIEAIQKANESNL